MREELGEVAASGSGVSKWASIPLKNSERDVQKTMEVQGTKLGVPISTIVCAGAAIPWINPRDWLLFLLRKGLWHRLAGLDYEEKHLAPQIWTQFWSNYGTLNPHFGIFATGVDLSRTAAFFIHGDEGRTLKRAALMVTTLQSALGFGFGEKRLKVPLPEAFKLRVNYTGHTLTTRFVVSTMPKGCYDNTPQVFQAFLDTLAQCLRDLSDEGIVDPLTGERYRICVIGCKGDLPYLQKTGNLVRAFNTGVKRGKEAKKPKGVCHLCLGGTSDDYPAEEIQTRDPRWLQTVAVQLPWEVTPPFIQHMYHDVSDPAAFFMPDLWHNFHLGVGKAYVASVVQLCLTFVPAPNLEAKWAWLSAHYRAFCQGEKRQPHITKLTGYLMSYGDKTGAMGAWSKGALTTNFVKWLPALIAALPDDEQGYLKECADAAQHMNALFGSLFTAAAFLDANEGSYIANLGFAFLCVYNKMAHVCYNAGRPYLFPMYPKLHHLHHTWIKILQDITSAGYAINPLVTACQQDEDAIGRTSRISRRVSIRLTMTRTLERVLVLAHSCWVEAGMLTV